jgi:hypothetical protein
MPKGKRPEAAASAERLLPDSASANGEDEKDVGTVRRRLCGRCIKVSIVIVVLYVLVKLVGWLMSFAGGSGSSPAPSPAPKDHQWSNALCAVPVEEYHKTKQIVADCKTIEKWEALAGISKVDDGGCFYNKTSRAIDCSRKESCHGGDQQKHKWDSTVANMTYDCGKCSGALRVNCCKTCEDVKQSDSNFIHCLACEKSALEHIVSKNTAECSLDEDGFFSCETKDSCRVLPEVSDAQVRHSITCSITPCDVCTHLS